MGRQSKNEIKGATPFRVGRVFNKISNFSRLSRPVLRSLTLNFPGRLNAMAIDPSRIAMNEKMVYQAGEVVFSIGLYKRIHVKRLTGDALVISPRSKRKPLITHAFLLMKKALGFTDGMYIDVDNNSEIRHAGLGSSSGLIAGVATAINELYSSPIPAQTLVKYLAQNHGEEIDGNTEYLYPVQCLGGAAAAGLFAGGLIVLAGENVVVASASIPSKYFVVIGIPNDFVERDSQELLNVEIKNMNKFIETGVKYGPTIAYNIVHRLLPAMVEGNLTVIGDVIYEYRFSMGSIKNCSYTYRKLPALMDKLAFLKTKGIAEVLSISSVGPGIFTITKDPKTCLKVFQSHKLNTTLTTITNDKYKIIDKVK